MKIVPVSLREAQNFVMLHHRHNGPPRGHKFSVGLASDAGLLGVAIAGRPVSRHQDDGTTLEITRVCVIEARNGCSRLYAACCAAGRALGFRRAITYTRQDENGSSLKASGFVVEAEVRAEQWGRQNRPRGRHEAIAKLRWVRHL